MWVRLGPYFQSCLLALTAGHMFNTTVILYQQELVGSAQLSGLGFGLAFGSAIVFGRVPVCCVTAFPRSG
jgi:hypothetical protein